MWEVCTGECLGVNRPGVSGLWAPGRTKYKNDLLVVHFPVLGSNGYTCWIHAWLGCTEGSLLTVCAVWFYSDVPGYYSFIQNFLRISDRKQTWNKVHTNQRKTSWYGRLIRSMPEKSLCLFTFQCGISRSTVYTATKLLQLQPYKMMDVQNLPLPNCEIRIWYCIWFWESLFGGLLDPEFML